MPLHRPILGRPGDSRLQDSWEKAEGALPTSGMKFKVKLEASATVYYTKVIKVEAEDAEEAKTKAEDRYNRGKLFDGTWDEDTPDGWELDKIEATEK